jgi:hypothetical protein
VCSTCVNNKHECAGYGDDSASTHDAKENKKPARKESNAPPPRKAEQPVDPQLTRPPLQQNISTVLQRSDSTSGIHMLKREEHGPNGVLSLSTRNRMPYFRYFGPTAIMPGFKQMVVKVRGKQHGSGQTASDRMCSTGRLEVYTNPSRTRSCILTCTTRLGISTGPRTTNTPRDPGIRCIGNLSESADHSSVQAILRPPWLLIPLPPARTLHARSGREAGRCNSSGCRVRTCCTFLYAPDADRQWGPAKSH